jgi:hypothetical protein
MDSRIITARGALRLGIGLMATFAGVDKFFNLLTYWPGYVAPFAAHLLPVSAQAFMYAVGMIEFAVGMTILFVRPSLGAFVGSAWLLLVAGNLVLSGHFDVAVRDIVLAVAAFALGELSAVPQSVPGTNDASSTQEVPHHALRASRL